MRCAPDELAQVAQLVEELCGIVLDETKAYLVESRLAGLVGSAGCQSYGELVQLVRGGRDTELRALLLDAITTNETSFFRDGAPFQALRQDLLPELLERRAGGSGGRRLRILSAASSTGQEALSVAVLLADLLGDELADWQLEIVGADISGEALERAASGTYSEAEVGRGLSAVELSRYFTRVGTAWRVRPELYRLLRFEQRNLLEPLTGLGAFDLILCRNVSIYFRPEVRRDLYLRLARQLLPGGYRIAGASESLRELDPRFEPEVRRGAVVYRPSGRK